MNKYFASALSHFVRSLAIFVVFIILSGCNEEILDATPTKEPCPTTVVSIPMNKSNSPKLIVVLVKEIPSYKEYTFQALNILLNTLPEFMEPGDRLVMLSMEQINLENALILDEEVPFVEKREFALSPTPPPMLGPLPSPTVEPKGDFMEAVATNDAIKFLKQTATVATQTAYEYKCAIEAWKSINQDQLKKWNTEKGKAISTFVSFVSQEIDQNKEKGFHVSKNQVFEAIQIAASLLKDECDKYAKCHLLIISDLDDSRNYRPENITISLQGYDVTTLMLSCKYKSQCEKRIEFWKENMSFYGAADPQFVLSRDVEEFLISHYGR